MIETPVECPPTGRYMPVREGASWTYQVTKTAGTEMKTQTVGPQEDVGSAKAGVLAYRFTTTKPGGSVISWQQDTGTALVRHREQDLSGAAHTDELYWDHHTRIDEDPARIALGATWSEAYDEQVTDLATMQTSTANKVDSWTVESIDRAITVPAGSFCTLVVRRTTTVAGTPGSSKTYFWARGVGKVKEQSAGGSTEELVEYTP